MGNIQWAPMRVPARPRVLAHPTGVYLLCACGYLLLRYFRRLLGVLLSAATATAAAAAAAAAIAVHGDVLLRI